MLGWENQVASSSTVITSCIKTIDPATLTVRGRDHTRALRTWTPFGSCYCRQLDFSSGSCVATTSCWFGCLGEARASSKNKLHLTCHSSQYSPANSTSEVFLTSYASILPISSPYHSLNRLLAQKIFSAAASSSSTQDPSLLTRQIQPFPFLPRPHQRSFLLGTSLISWAFIFTACSSSPESQEFGSSLATSGYSLLALRSHIPQSLAFLTNHLSVLQANTYSHRHPTLAFLLSAFAHTHRRVIHLSAFFLARSFH